MGALYFIEEAKFISQFLLINYVFEFSTIKLLFLLLKFGKGRTHTKKKNVCLV